jgi:tetratricopeptide (TPR) repeat protein
MRPSLAAALLFVTAASPLSAQLIGKEKAPKRPELQAGADTNSAGAFYYYGTYILERDPGKAADAFYWASRLDPSWADPLYARKIALHMKDRPNLVRYVFRDRALMRDKEVRQIDSLQYYALLRNPFLYTKLDRVMFQTALSDLTRGTGQLPLFLRSDESNPWLTAWLAYTNANFPRALEYYDKAIKKDKKDYSIHGDRARAFFQIANLDSAIVEQQKLIDAVRNEDKDKLVYVYDSKAMFEYGLGKLHQANDNLDSAKAAFGRALTEDLSFYMAHAALAGVHLAQGDTAGAIAEYDVAVQLRGDDASLRTSYGYVLALASKPDEAIPHLRKAIELEPYFAPPYFFLGRMLEMKSDTEALDQYEKFLARARADDARRDIAMKVLTDFGRPPKKPASPM